jgi:hypothetical protein
MSATVYYDNAVDAAAVCPVEFVNYTTGVATDPASVSCVVTDPLGSITTYNYPGSGGLNSIVRTSTGAYTLTLDGLTSAGLWSYVWLGSGSNVQMAVPGTFRIVALTQVGMGMQYWYTGLDELKSRLGISYSDHASDFEIQLAIQCVTNWVNEYCGEHFYQVTEARTYMNDNIWTLPIDALVSTPSIVSNTVVKLDYEGSGVFSTNWGAPSFAGSPGAAPIYTFKLGTTSRDSRDNFNINAAGVPRPYRQLQVLSGIANASTGPGEWLPFVWPFTFMDRVQITGTWGWNFVPPSVQNAAMMLAVDLFKSKDAPWGVAGIGDLGIVKVQSNPWVVELLRPYINVRRKIGV